MNLIGSELLLFVGLCVDGTELFGVAIWLVRSSVQLSNELGNCGRSHLN
jgi:hypothetical protein